MKCLVTGAAGFIGSHLCTTLLNQGNEVWGIDNLSSGKVENLEDIRGKVDFRFFESCISNVSLMNELIRDCDIIYHLAAIVGVKHYVEDPIRVIDVNVRFTSELLKLALKWKKKVVFTSTSEVYGKSDSIPFEEDGNRVYGPSSTDRWCYAISKTADEHLCFGYGKKGLPIVILRYFNIYGPKADCSAYGGVVTRFISQALRGEPLTVHGDGSQTRCFTYVDDIIQGTIEASLRPEAEGKIFNLGSPKEISILNLAYKVLEAFDFRGEMIFQPHEEFYGPSYEDIPRRIPDLTMAEGYLDYFPQITLEEGLKKTIDWYRK